MQIRDNKPNNLGVKAKTPLARIGVALLLMTGFAILVLVNLTLTEKVKAAVARSIGYNTSYYRASARNFYSSKAMNDEKTSIVERWNYEEDFFEKDAGWKSFIERNERDLAIINWSGRLFVILVSIAGWMVYFSRRRKGKLFGTTDWLCIFTGMFFMRDVVLDALGVCTKVWLNDFALWAYIGLPSYGPFVLSVILGLAFFVFILYKLPKRILPMFIICGLIGSSGGAFLWLRTMAKAHPPGYAHKMPANGATAPDFIGTVHGKNDNFHLSEYRDSIIVLDFFFSTCGPCLHLIPHINMLNDKYRSRGVIFLGINPIENDWKRLDRFLKKIPVHYPVLKVNEKVAKAYGVRGYPTLFIINKGRVVFSNAGAGGDVQSLLEQELEITLKR